jgi:hypothetical protein
MNKAQLEALESEVNAELYSMKEAGHEANYPITDGVVDIERYLADSPKLLWILKEPWDTLAAGEVGGDWSITKLLQSTDVLGNKGTWARMAYVSYAVFHDCPEYSQIPYVTEGPKVRDALRRVAYINVKKFPGTTQSDDAEIARYYSRYGALLRRQINAINPDIVIAGNILHLFYDDFGLSPQDMTAAGSLEFCCRDHRLYINAYHPGYWSFDGATYVRDLYAVIKRHFPAPPAP